MILALDARALLTRLLGGRARALIVPDQPDDEAFFIWRARTPLMGLVAPRASLWASYWPRILLRIEASFSCEMGERGISRDAEAG